MKVLHIASLTSARANIGVVKQMSYEKDAADSLNLNWDVELWTEDKIPSYSVIKNYPKENRTWLGRRWYFFRRISKLSEVYDVILVRYAPVDFFLPFLGAKGAKLIFIHHTKECAALRTAYGGKKGSILSHLESILGGFSIRNADGLIGVTPEILAYEETRSKQRKTLRYIYPNGISFEHFPVVNGKREGKIKILFTASVFHKWHGLSMILRELYAFDRRSEVELHLVGHLLDEDKEFVKSNSTTGVVLHGYLEEKNLRQVLGSMDVALASFGLGDNGMTEACTLKVREYLAAGVPVYSGHCDVGFDGEFEYYKMGEIDFKSILKYAQSMRSIPREEVRMAAREHIEKKWLVRRLHSFLSHYI